MWSLHGAHKKEEWLQERQEGRAGRRHPVWPALPWLPLGWGLGDVGIIIPPGQVQSLVKAQRSLSLHGQVSPPESRCPRAVQTTVPDQERGHRHWEPQSTSLKGHVALTPWHILTVLPQHACR